jgi:hypothetical protein
MAGLVGAAGWHGIFNEGEIQARGRIRGVHVRLAAPGDRRRPGRS